MTAAAVLAVALLIAAPMQEKPMLKFVPALPGDLASQVADIEKSGESGICHLYSKPNCMLLVAAFVEGKLARWHVLHPVGEEEAQRVLTEAPGDLLGGGRLQ